MSATLIEVSSLFESLLASTNILEPMSRPDPTYILGPLASIEELFQVFMYIYINIIKNQAQIQALISTTIPLALVKPKEKALKARFCNLYSRKLNLNCY